MNSNMHHYNTKILILLILSLILIQTGCAQGLKGKIYLDENNNTIRDDGENLLAGLTFTVTLDDKEIDTGITDETGNYSVPMDGQGEYCVIVKNSDLETSSVTRVASLFRPLIILKNKTVLWAKHLIKSFGIQEALAIGTESDCNDGDDNDEDGFKDCDDTDCASDSSCNVNDCIATDSDTDGIPDCTESLCSSAAACTTDSTTDSTSNTATTSNMQACKTATGLVLELDVPVQIDYDASTTDLDNTQTISKQVGDSFTLDITYPTSCTLSQIRLPNYIEPSSATIKSNYYSTSTHKLDIQDAFDATSDCTDEAASTPAYDVLRTCPIEFNVISNGVIGTESETFQPTVICPDEQSYSLDQFTLRKDAGNDITITIVNTDGNSNDTWEASDDVTQTITITNNSTINIVDSDFDFEVSTPSAAQGQSSSITSGSCTGSQTISCDFDLAAGNSVVLTVEFTLPGSISGTTNFQTAATFTVNSTDTDFSETSTITVN